MEAFWHDIVPTIYNFLFFRFFSNYFGSGSGFQLEYESTNVSLWTIRMGECGGSFTTPNGILTSPSYPSHCPDNADCIYTISQPTGTVILFKFLSMDIYTDYWDPLCAFRDYLEIRDGPQADSPRLAKLCGRYIPDDIQSGQNHLWIKLVMNSDKMDKITFHIEKNFKCNLILRSIICTLISDTTLTSKLMYLTSSHFT